MKALAMTAIWGAAALAAQAEGSVDTQLAAITVYVQFPMGNLPDLPVRAEWIASQILAQAGVTIRWRSGEPKAHQETHSILVEITSDTAATLSPGALAYAEVHGHGNHIRVFWDRVNNTGGASLGCALLGHVIAHEITHLLEGVNRHSLSGVMKARWSEDDILQMGNEPLVFDPSDVLLIRQGMADYVQPAKSRGRSQQASSRPATGNAS
jgi:hypothetical protein